MSVLAGPDGAQFQARAGRVRVAVRRARGTTGAKGTRGHPGGRRGPQFLLGRHPSRPNRKVQRRRLMLDAEAPVVARARAGGVAGNRAVKTRGSS